MKNFLPSKKFSVDDYLGDKNRITWQKRLVFYLAVLLIVVAGGGYFLYQEAQKQKVFKEEIAVAQKAQELEFEQKLSESQKPSQELFSNGIDLLKRSLTNISVLFLEEAAKKDPKWRDAAYYTGYAYLQLAKLGSRNPQENLQKAKDYLEKARTLDPIYAPTYELLAVTYQALGDEENAQICYNKAKEFKKD